MHVAINIFAGIFAELHCWFVSFAWVPRTDQCADYAAYSNSIDNGGFWCIQLHAPVFLGNCFSKEETRGGQKEGIRRKGQHISAQFAVLNVASLLVLAEERVKQENSDWLYKKKE